MRFFAFFRHERKKEKTLRRAILFMKNATTTKKEYEYYRLAKEAIDRGEAENALFNI